MPSGPSTVLLDLVDGVDEGARAGIAQLVRQAIAPAPWATGIAALGTELSAPAGLYRIAAVPAAEVPDLMALADRADVEGVELEGVYAVPPVPEPVALPKDLRGPVPARPAPFRPDDPYYRHQWHLDQIQMPEAWNLARGDGVVVAVLDTGVSVRDREDTGFRGAPDLAGTAVVPGWDFIDGDDRPDDRHGHGTHVAGTIAQTTNNGLGVAGVAPGAAIMPVRVLDARGAGRFGTVAAGIRWATDHGARVINLSLGGGLPSGAIRRAVQHAHQHGVVVVAAAGNAGSGRVGYPAGHDGAIAVGAVRYDRTLAFYSNHGRGLDLVAPGGDTRVDQNDDGLPDGVLQNVPVGGDKQTYDYVPFMGTSMASPHVAGVAALLLGTGLIDDPDAVGDVLRSHADPLDGDRVRYGAGLLQARDALAAIHRGRGGLGAGGALLLAGAAFGWRPRRWIRWAGHSRKHLGGALALGVAVAGGVGLVWPGSWTTALTTWATRGALALGGGNLGGDVAVLALLGVWVPLAVQALLGSVRVGSHRVGPGLVAGTAIGIGGLALAEAICPARQLLSPGVDPWVGPWLLGQAAACLAVARVVVRQAPGSGSATATHTP